ncbi:hypothetical protein IMSHALPRED_004400 [Imshaugia aleurites]|uniref:Uncharacterized protein n=1 Tax=Imshaugia aleurites TaxID=172621 RepID=A0A8H3F824_9LECA|nr:hypothetical protein IMSHALPRED_004400 [Imshaugia aleurites]
MHHDELGAPTRSCDYDDDDTGIRDDDEQWTDQEDGFGQKHYQPRVLNILLRFLINKVPNECLQTFRISEKTLKLVARRHGHSLTTLQINNCNLDRPSEFDFFALTTLDAGDMIQDVQFSWEVRAEAKSYKSLTHLKIGYETTVARSYLGWRDPLAMSAANDFTWSVHDEIFRYLPACSQEFSNLDKDSDLPRSILHLKSLHLVGLDCDFTTGMSTKLATMLDTDKLTSLCLESCFDLEQSFRRVSPLTNTDVPPPLPQLRSFRLRQEGCDAVFQDSLKAFLLALKGLVHLAVLLEGFGPFLPPDCIIGNHGLTLRTLVWDQRRGPRQKLEESTSTATQVQIARSLDKIVEECPNLEELGLAVNALIYGNNAYGPRRISQLKQLKTLNLRVLPIQKADAETSSFPRIHEMIATDIANALLKNGLRLETLGLGSITWTDIWQGRSRFSKSSGIDTYLCPRIFHIDYPVNLRGESQPLITQIAQGTATEAKEYSSNLRIFEPYWLG